MRKDHLRVERKVLIVGVKYLAIVLGFFSVLVNVAGGWVGVYPLGGEGMIDPIWGIPGHISTMLSWISINIDFPGRFSIDFLRGEYAGGFQLNLIIATFQMYLTWPSASSLARGEPSAFFGALLLAFFVNPYINPLKFGQFVVEKFRNIQLPKERLMQGAIMLEAFLLFFLTFWFLLDLSVLANLPIVEYLAAVESGFHTTPSSGIVIIDYFLKQLLFVIGKLFSFFFLRTRFSLSEWTFRALLFLGITLIIWYPMRVNNKSEILKTVNSQLTNIYLRLASYLSTVYLITGVILLPLMTERFSFFSILTQIFYYALFILTLEVAFTPYTLKQDESSPQASEEETDSINPSFEVPILAVSSFILLIFLIGGVILKLSVFESSVVNLMIIAVGFSTFICLIPIYGYLAQKYYLKQTILSYNPAEGTRREITLIQSILVIGGGFVTFILLLIQTLYKTLSTVPDTSILQQYPEDEFVFSLLVVGFLLCLGIAIGQYIRTRTHSGTNHMQS